MHFDNYIIIHGSFGSKDGNWFPWLKRQLESKENWIDVPQCLLELAIKTLKVGLKY